MYIYMAQYCVFCCGSLLTVLGDVSPYICSYYFSSVWIAEWPPFRKELLTRLTICSLCILTICDYSPDLKKF